MSGLLWSQKGNFLHNRANAPISCFMIFSHDMFVTPEARCWQLLLILTFVYETSRAHAFILWCTVRSTILKPVELSGVRECLWTRRWTWDVCDFRWERLVGWFRGDAAADQSPYGTVWFVVIQSRRPWRKMHEITKLYIADILHNFFFYSTMLHQSSDRTQNICNYWHMFPYSMNLSVSSVGPQRW